MGGEVPVGVSVGDPGWMDFSCSDFLLNHASHQSDVFSPSKFCGTSGVSGSFPSPERPGVNGRQQAGSGLEPHASWAGMRRKDRGEWQAAGHGEAERFGTEAGPG